MSGKLFGERMKLIYSFVFLIIVMMSLCLPSYAIENTSNIEKSMQPYSYPSIQNEQWNTWDLSQRKAYLQLPDNLVDNMSTEALVESVLNYPFMIDLLAFNSFREGFLKVKSELPALDKLIQRKDLSKVFTDRFISLNQSSNLSSNEAIAQKMYASILLAQPEINNKLSVHDSDLLHQSFIKTNNNLYDSAKQQLEKRVLTVSTPFGTPVYVIDTSNYTDFTESEKILINANAADLYSVKVISNPTIKYNCHSYAWYSPSTLNHYWMPEASTYIYDGSYTQRTGAIQVGDKVYWVTGEHSGIVSYVGQSGIGNIKVISKWGSMGLYEHYLGGPTPYTTNTTSIWKR